MASLTAWAVGQCFVPLKGRCSRKWDSPACSGVSYREPAPTHMTMDTDRVWGMVDVRTRSWLSRTERSYILNHHKFVFPARCGRGVHGVLAPLAFRESRRPPLGRAPRSSLGGPGHVSTQVFRMGPRRETLVFMPGVSNGGVQAVPRVNGGVVGSTKSLRVMLSITVLRSPGLPVLPGPPGNKVSPENKCFPVRKHLPPSVWPGVASTWSSRLPKRITSPSSNRYRAAGGARGRPECLCPPARPRWQ